MKQVRYNISLINHLTGKHETDLDSFEQKSRWIFSICYPTWKTPEVFVPVVIKL